MKSGEKKNLLACFLPIGYDILLITVRDESKMPWPDPAGKEDGVRAVQRLKRERKG